MAGRESIAAKLVANILTEAGANRVLAMDLHSGQCVGYFDIPVDHVYGEAVLLEYLSSKRISTGASSNSKSMNCIAQSRERCQEVCSSSLTDATGPFSST